MTFEEIKPDIFDINRDMPTAPTTASLPRHERLSQTRSECDRIPKLCLESEGVDRFD